MQLGQQGMQIRRERRQACANVQQILSRLRRGEFLCQDLTVLVRLFSEVSQFSFESGCGHGGRNIVHVGHDGLVAITMRWLTFS